MSVKRTGDWEAARQAMLALQPVIEQACDEGMMKIGLKGEALAKGHVSADDLGWDRLKPATIAYKIRKGYHEAPYLMTGTYFQSITSWHDKVKGIVYAGVKKGVVHVNDDGSTTQVADIAEKLEFGSRDGSQVERPLWRPVTKEVKQWIRMRNPIKTAINQKLSKLFKK